MQIAIRVQCRSARPGNAGWRTGADGREELEVPVAEAPANGAANVAVVAVVAKALGLSGSEVSITARQASRHKCLSVPLEREAVIRRLGGERRKD
jgi:uncharacterized protein YggU (UPF0235/DUF167 family)